LSSLHIPSILTYTHTPKHTLSLSLAHTLTHTHTHTHAHTHTRTHAQMNLGGASDRPVPRDIWTIVQTKLTEPENTEKVQLQYNRVRRRGVCSACTIL